MIELEFIIYENSLPVIYSKKIALLSPHLMINNHSDYRLTLDILDCGGSNEFPAMKRIGILNSNAFILVYSIEDADSFEEVRRLRELIWEIKLEKHIAKYSTGTEKQQQISIKNDTFVKKETNSIISSINLTRQPPDLKLGQQLRYSLQTPLNGTYTNGRTNSLVHGKLNSNINKITGQLSNPVNGQSMNDQINNQQEQQTIQTKRHHHHHQHKKTNETKSYKKPYINQRYKLSENLKLISERRKSLTNSTKIGELKSKLDDISETTNDITHQSTADILCFRPASKLQTTSLPVYGTTNAILIDKQQTQLAERTNDDILDEESNIIKNNVNRGRRRSSFLLSPDSLSSDSSCSSSDSECESENCEESSCSSNSSCCSMNNLNSKLVHHKQQEQDKENKTNNFEHINNLNVYKSKLERLKEQERILLNEDIPPFDPPVIVVVGNKCDLECKRTVQRDLAENIVQIDWDNGFLECSAKNNYNMTAIFKEMLKQSKLPFVVSNALDSQKNRRRSLPAYPNLHLKEPTFRTKRNSCALS